MVNAHRSGHARAGRYPRFLPLAALLLLLAALAACDGTGEDATEPPTRALGASAGTPAATPEESSAATPAGAAPPAASPAATPTPIAPIELTPGPDVTAEQVLRFGAGRVANLESVHFKVTIEGTVHIDEERTIQLVSAEGNVVRPGRVQTQFRIRIRGQAISSIRMIGVEGEFWMTDLVTGEWVPAAEEFTYDPSILFDPSKGLAPVMLGVEDPRLLGTEEVDGRAAYLVEATGGEELIGPVTSYTLTGYPVTVRAWIDQETGDPLKVVLVESPSPENADPSTWTLELSRFDADITVEPPEVGED